MSSATLRGWTGSILEFDLDSDGRYALDGDWTPAEPQLIADALYDLESPIIDEIPIVILGATRDDLIENRSRLARYLYRAARYAQNPRSSSARYLEYAPPGATNAARVEILGGSVSLEDDIAGRDKHGKYIQRGKLRAKRRPVWEGTEESITLATEPSDNGANNVAVLPTLDGDLPARCKIYLTGSGGQIANVKRIMAALRADAVPANFLHFLKCAGNPTGVSVTVPGTVVIAADADLISGSRARYTPTGTGEVNVLTWDITTPISIADQFQRSLVFVRYRDRAAAPNFKFRARFGAKISASYVWGPWIPETPLETLYADSTATTELGMLLLGQAQISGVGTEDEAIVTLAAQLACTATAASNSIDIDGLPFYPLGESDDGKGLALAEFTQAMSSNRAYLNFLHGQPRAYLANSSGAILIPPTSLPEGGEILLWPNQDNPQRLYFALLRALDDGTAPSAHDKSITLTATLTYKPRYLFMRGTS